MLRLRLKYEKQGPIRFASHRDLMRVFRRSLASAEIPVSFSQGFNPHPRFSFGPSLRTGWESRDEYLDVFVDAPVDGIGTRCNPRLPEGLRIVESVPVGASVPKLAADVTGARYEVYLAERDAYDPGIGTPKGFLETLSNETRTDGPMWRRRVLDALVAEVIARFGVFESSGPNGAGGEPRPPAVLEVRAAEIDGATDTRVMIEYFSTMHGGKSLFPEDILTPILGEPANYTTPIRVVRGALYVERGGRYVSPSSREALETEK
jgi:hypothetical protein